MKIKAGRYTLALTLIASGVLMFINTYSGNEVFKNLWMYSPLVLILFGLEIIILNLVYMNREDRRVEVSVGSMLFIIIVIAIFMIGTSDMPEKFMHEPFYDNFF